MSQTERINQIMHLLETSRRPVPIQRFMATLEISRATFKRDMEYLRERLGAPIEWQSGNAGDGRGYVLCGSRPGARQRFGIQGLWFNQSEIHALLLMHQLASNMEPGLIAERTKGLLARIRMLLGEAEDDPDDVLARIQVLHSATRRRNHAWFEVVAKATMSRRRLLIRYFTRSRAAESERVVSPKRLLHYRENWYLLGWCHQADELRLFAVDAIRNAEIQPHKARVVARARLDDFIGHGFGVFAGHATRRARLRFNADSARWVQDEVWHPRQKTRWEGESLVIEVPYSQPQELLMEVLRHGPNVEVLGPPELRTLVTEQLAQAIAQYR